MTIILGATHTYTIAFVCMLVLAGADAMSIFIRATSMPLITPLEAWPCARGRNGVHRCVE